MTSRRAFSERANGPREITIFPAKLRWPMVLPKFKGGPHPRSSDVTSSVSSPVPRLYPQDLEPALQEELAALADIEERHDKLRCRLAGWRGPQSLRDRLLEQLEARRQEAREPLGALHQRLMSFRLFPRRSMH